MVAGVALALFAMWRVLAWIRRTPRRPDPWDAETEHAVQAEDAVPVCHRCFASVPPGQWFCESCGCAVGPYNNYMPYVNAFSEGEVLRAGTGDRLPRNSLIVIGYLLYSLVYIPIAPVYWYFLFRNLSQKQSRPLTDRPE